MRTAVVLSILLALTACEDSRRASRHDRYDDDSRSYGGLDGLGASTRHARRRKDVDDQLRKIDDDLLQLQQQIAPSGTGAWECDELVRLTNCAWDKYGTAVPDSARQAFADGVNAWRDALSSSATRQATIEACKMSLDAGKAGFDAMGCY